MALFQPPDDYRFAAVIRLGPVVSSAARTYVRVTDSTGKFAFAMTLLEASLVEAKHPSFASVGLLGYWKLTSGKLVLDIDIDSTDPKAVLVSDDNPSWIREAYVAAFSHI